MGRELRQVDEIPSYSSLDTRGHSYSSCLKTQFFHQVCWIRLDAYGLTILGLGLQLSWIYFRSSKVFFIFTPKGDELTKRASAPLKLLQSCHNKVEYIMSNLAGVENSAPIIRSTIYHQFYPTHFRPLQISPQKAPNSPLVPSSISCSSFDPYFFLYSTLIFSKCRGSQWKRTRRLTSSSVRSLEVSARAWWRRRASRTGRLSTPLRMCARVSPYGVGKKCLVSGLGRRR